MSLKLLAISLVYLISVCHNFEGRNIEATNTIVGFSVTKDCTLRSKKMIITLTLATAVTGDLILVLKDDKTNILTVTCKGSQTVATQLICLTVDIDVRDYKEMIFKTATLQDTAINIADSITKSFYYSALDNEADLIQTTPQLIDYSESTKNFFTIKFKTSMTNQDIKIYAQKEAQKITLSKECSVDSTDSKILNCRSISKATLPKGDHKITYSVCPPPPPIPATPGTPADPVPPMTSIIDLKVLDDNLIYDNEDKDKNNSSLISVSYLTSLALIYLLL